MSVIYVRSIAEAVGKGTLIDLVNDYRTSGIIRGYLPRDTDYRLAISSTAYGRHVLQSTAQERPARLEAILFFVKRIFEFNGKPSASDLRFQLVGSSGRPEYPALKMEWYAPNMYWVVLLADEQLEAIERRQQTAEDLLAVFRHVEDRHAVTAS